MGRVKNGLWLGASAAALLGVAPAQAQSPPQSDARASSGTAIEEVVVTARRREENLQKVPVAVTAITSQQLENRQIESVGDLAVPGLNFSPAGASQGRFYIRGIGGTNEVTFDAGVGVYIDGVYVGRAQGADFELLDLQRVEVLRGPQGTLFGRNTVGGAINLISQLPDNSFSARAKITAGNLDRFAASEAVTIPVVPGILSGRISLAVDKRRGYTSDLVNGHRYDNEKSLGARAVFRLTPNEELEFVASADWSKQDIEGNGTHCKLVNPAAGALFLFNLASVRQGFGSFADQCVATTSQGVRKLSMGERTAALSFDGAEQWGVSLNSTWRPSASLALKSITAYRKLNSAQFDDTDATPPILIEINRQTDDEEFSQEFQAQGDLGSNLSYTAGVYYLKEITPRHDEIVIPAFLPTPQETRQKVERTSYAVYGQAVYNLTDALKLTAGGRYTWDEQAYQAFDRDTVSGVVSNLVDPTSKRFEAFTHLLNLSYQVTPDILTYVSWATGFKSGGFNTDNTPGFEASFSPEHNDSYEIGVKSILLERRLLLNVAAYQSDYRDQQVLVQAFNPQTGAVSPLFQNAAKSKIRGFEAELEAQLTDTTRITASYAYTHARYLSFDSRDIVTLQPISLADRKMPNTPAHQINVDAEQHIPLSQGGFFNDLVLRASYRYYSPLYLEITNDPNLRRGSRSEIDASIALVSEDSDLDIRIWGKNLTNETYLRRGYTFAQTFGFVGAVYSEPRTYGVTVSKRF